MAYTRPWSVVTPAGGIPAKQIDDEIRKLRVDVEERMETLVEDMATDPVVLKPEYRGAKTDVKLLIGFPEFYTSNDNKPGYTAVDAFQAFTDSHPLVAMIRVPVGCTIKLVELLTSISPGGSLIWQVRYNPFAGVASSIIATVNHATLAKSISSTEILNNLVDNNGFYSISIEASGSAGIGFSLYGARVTFDRPSVQEAT